MEDLVELVQNPFVLGFAAAWLIGMLAYALPKPDPDGGKGYVVLYRSVQFCAANLELMKNKQLPPQPRSAVE